jgi:hypothetical protein
MNLYSDVAKTVEGTPAEVEAELLRIYPFLNSSNPNDHGDVPNLIEHLNCEQAYEAEIVDHGNELPLHKSEPSNLQGQDDEVVAAMLGYHHKLNSALDAVKFLAGGAPASGERVRQALWEADGDPEEAALRAYGLEVSPSNLAALRGFQSLSKAQPEPVQAQTIEPGHPDAGEVAERVGVAFRDRFVLPVALGGKHSKGSMLARDQKSEDTWLLKPGSGGQSPAAGAKEDPSSQSRREAAFWHVADAWHLGQFLPRADLLLIDGREYAAIHLLPWSYKTLDKVKGQDVQAARALLYPFLRQGMCHRWGVLDYVLGNPDRHAQNLMVKDGAVKLIDHGSAFAGNGFDPAHDQNSFIPFYLRAWADGRFSQMTAEQKLKVMPRLDRQTAEELGKWLDGLHAEDLDRVLIRYGVNPQPAKDRLAKLKALSTQMPVDEAVNRVWATTDAAVEAAPVAKAEAPLTIKDIAEALVKFRMADAPVDDRAILRKFGIDETELRPSELLPDEETE